MRKPKGHFLSDVAALEVRLQELAAMPGPHPADRVQEMIDIQRVIEKREARMEGRARAGGESDYDVAMERGELVTQAEIFGNEVESSSLERMGGDYGELGAFLKVQLFSIIESRTPRREAVCFAMACGFAHPAYPSMRAAAAALACSPTEISERVMEIQRANNLPANQYNKSEGAKATYAQTNGRR